MKNILGKREEKFTHTSQIYVKILKYQKLRGWFLLAAIPFFAGAIAAKSCHQSGYCIFCQITAICSVLVVFVMNFKVREYIVKLQKFIDECNQ
jgi:ABC-type Na+ efflux pump permease subunit